MGGCLSVSFPEGETAILKVGMDEVIFKMYATNQSSWEADGVKKISHKGDCKGNMKVVFVDKVTGLGGNNITVEQWEKFNEKSKKDH